MSRRLSANHRLSALGCQLLVLLLASSARAQFPERRAEESNEPESVPEAAAPAAPSDTSPRPTPETVEETVRRLMRMLLPTDLHVGLHGYFRAPLRLSINRRSSPMAGESAYNIRTPWLVDDDYFRSGFAYTRIQEQDWTELYLSVGNKYLTGEVALMGSLYSDWAQPLIDRQWGIAQGFLRFHWDAAGPRSHFAVQAKAGAFWERLGWLQRYDTYLFARTHQMGGQVRIDAGFGHWNFSLMQGMGAHLEALDQNEGLTILNYVAAGARWKRNVEVGFYFLDSLSHDKRQLKEINDANLRVYGVDARLTAPYLGSQLYFGGSKLEAVQATYLAPAIEVMHAYGGRGLTENYLGTQRSENGTGTLYNFAWDYSFSLANLLRAWSPRRGEFFGRSDVTLAFFGVLTHVNSKQADPDPQINRDGRTLYKWGLEGGWTPLSWLALALRYDRVVLDVKDDANSFRVVSPRISLRTHWLVDGEIFLQWSYYTYGARVQLRPGQVALETQPDSNVLKIQAQLVF
ncbi:MAG: hypothetical protein JWN44_3652 [Myxococcales bacterium]|nr:hypothetical protein [Myxococcales bacterium]